MTPKRLWPVVGAVLVVAFVTAANVSFVLAGAAGFAGPATWGPDYSMVQRLGATLVVLEPGIVEWLVLAGVLGTVGEFYVLTSQLGSQTVVGGTPTEDLQTRVRRMARQVGVPEPEVYRRCYGPPNCYTVGRRGDAKLVVTDSLVETLTDEELDAVLAHELAHVVNRDVTAMTLLTGYFRTATGAINWVQSFAKVLGTAVLVVVAAFVITGLTGDSSGPGLLEVGVPFALVVGWFAFWTVALLALLWLSAKVPSALSQYRELAADRGAAAITGNPAALASALQRLGDASVPESDLRRVRGSMVGLFLLPWNADGLSTDGPTVLDAYSEVGDDGEVYFDADRLVAALVDSHPSTDERIERLEVLAAEQERS